MFVSRAGLLSLLLLGLVCASRGEEPAGDGWIEMFNGRDLEGWKASEHPENWKVEEGAIVATGPRSHLFYVAEEFDNFDWKAEIKLKRGTNSGMYFRAKFGPGWPTGYEAQVNNSAFDPVRTGSLYNLVKVFERNIKEDDVWFTQEVIAEGDHIVIKVNDKVTCDYVDPKFRHQRGYLALQQHDAGGALAYRNLKVKRLAATP